MSNIKIPRLTFWRAIYVVILALFVLVFIRRFTGGLGAVSNLKDLMPWGLWIGFDVMSGVALAAGGFTITAIVYIFHLEKYKPIVRSTVLTAFLGYLMVVLALLVDLGRPWVIWHPLIMWNDRSAMFELAWCVMLYTTVLFLEFLPLVFERFGKKHVVHWWHRYLTPVLCILGVLLSTMHQSSLGTLYVIVPEKLHPLWYSPILPYMFFISAIALGLAMVNVESFLSFRAFGKRLEPEILADLGKATAFMLMFYLVIRFEDLIVRHSLKYAFRLDLGAIFFWIEVGLLMIVPMIILMSDKLRHKPLVLAGAQFMVVLGMIFDRMNVTTTAFQLGTGVSYHPLWSEFAISIGVVAIGMGLFGLAVRYLPVFPEGPIEHPKPVDPYAELLK
ncbi:MAG: Ni/Fe-hydrogenase cytochrome b subunit [Nitrospiraceae bacterium]|nr:Ni/Fe-hydrogenase cytochrome b subunit [Nitrospiraceae bacterium]